MARKMQYTPELSDEICGRLAEGESLRKICSDAHMPARTTVLRWVENDHEGFASRYSTARDTGLDTMADSLMEISDDGSNDWMETNDPGNPGYRINGEHIQRSKLRVDARKWYLSKLAPKRYGDKTSMELTGADGGPVLLSDTERAARIAAIIAVAQARKARAQADADISDLL